MKAIIGLITFYLDLPPRKEVKDILIDCFY